MKPNFQNTLQVDSASRKMRTSRSRSIRDSPQQQSSSQSQKTLSVHSRIRKASAHEFAREIEEFDAFNQQKKKHMNFIQSFSPKKSQEKTSKKSQFQEKDIFLKSRLQDQLQTRLNFLTREQGLGENIIKVEGEVEDQELDYTTFRLVRRDEVSHLLELREKLQNHPLGSKYLK